MLITFNRRFIFSYSVASKDSALNIMLKMINMKLVLLLSLFVVFMATETEGGQVEDAFRIVFDSLDSDNDGTISSSDMGNVSSFRDSSHKNVCNLFGPPSKITQCPLKIVLTSSAFF